MLPSGRETRTRGRTAPLDCQALTDLIFHTKSARGECILKPTHRPALVFALRSRATVDFYERASPGERDGRRRRRCRRRRRRRRRAAKRSFMVICICVHVRVCVFAGFYTPAAWRRHAQDTRSAVAVRSTACTSGASSKGERCACIQLDRPACLVGHPVRARKRANTHTPLDAIAAPLG